MSDEADRPLTRRERRLREMAESGAVPTVVEAERQAPPAAVEAPAAIVEDEIEISSFNEDGTPRSRREIRELREQAMAARAERVAEAEQAAEAEQTIEVEQAPEVHQLDPQLEMTQPLSLQDLQEIAEDQAAKAAAEPVIEEPEAVLDAESEEVSDLEALFGAGAETEDEAEAEVETDPEAAEEAVLEEPAEAEVEEPAEEQEAENEKGYTFPDIAPLDESISVFDDPVVPGSAAPQGDLSQGGDFDDLISRAVAQEGAAGTTNSSALILPTLPDTGELSSPIGETGELFITGSIELPKSLGETGSHAPLHDSHEADLLGDLGLDEIPTSEDTNSPVSATRAVSAVGTGEAIVAQQTKEKSKLPLVLILTGGGLVVAVGALLIWGASAGMFG